MRQIKFRAWDKDNKKMIEQSGSSEGDFWYPIGFQMRSKYSEKESSSTNCILMQFTGLKDKNGKEIYEGDIVKGSWGKNHIDIFKIVFEGIMWSGIDKNNVVFVVDDYGEYPTYNLEVIGNIYENPELFK